MNHKNRLYQNILLVVSVLIVFIIFYIKFFSNEMNIKPFGIEVLIVKSNSMSPKFYKNDIIIIKEQSEYKIGDIITYETTSGILITHRIIEKKENGFYTKGDNNNTKDENIIKQEQIKGKVIFILNSKLGKFIKLVQQI